MLKVSQNDGGLDSTRCCSLVICCWSLLETEEWSRRILRNHYSLYFFFPRKHRAEKSRSQMHCPKIFLTMRSISVLRHWTARHPKYIVDFCRLAHLCPKPLPLPCEHNLSGIFLRKIKASENNSFDYLMLQNPKDIAASFWFSVNMMFTWLAFSRLRFNRV